MELNITGELPKAIKATPKTPEFDNKTWLLGFLNHSKEVAKEIAETKAADYAKKHFHRVRTKAGEHVTGLKSPGGTPLLFRP
jgi:hypothetical protein